MNATKKELDEVSNISSRLWPLVKVLATLMRPFSRLGFVRRRAEKSTGGRVGTISRHAERGEHEKAAALAIDALKFYRHQAKGTWMASGADQWWFFMHLAARSLEVCGDHEKWNEVIELSEHGVMPFRGHYVARSFLAFSNRKYKDGDYDKAIEFAEIAARADDTWAEPDFVLGWYRLVLGGGDPMKHLTLAIRKDHGILFRIENDPECCKHPHVVQRLKDLSADGIVSAREEPEVDDQDGSEG